MKLSVFIYAHICWPNGNILAGREIIEEVKKKNCAHSHQLCERQPYARVFGVFLRIECTLPMCGRIVFILLMCSCRTDSYEPILTYTKVNEKCIQKCTSDYSATLIDFN